MKVMKCRWPILNKLLATECQIRETHPDAKLVIRSWQDVPLLAAYFERGSGGYMRSLRVPNSYTDPARREVVAEGIRAVRAWINGENCNSFSGVYKGWLHGTLGERLRAVGPGGAWRLWPLFKEGLGVQWCPEGARLPDYPDFVIVLGWVSEHGVSVLGRISYPQHVAAFGREAELFLADRRVEFYRKGVNAAMDRRELLGAGKKRRKSRKRRSLTA